MTLQYYLVRIRLRVYYLSTTKNKTPNYFVITNTKISHLHKIIIGKNIRLQTRIIVSIFYIFSTFSNVNNTTNFSTRKINLENKQM